MADKLMEFLVESSKDSILSMAIKLDKKVAMAGFGLSAGDQQLVLGENYDEIEARCGNAAKALNLIGLPSLK